MSGIGTVLANSLTWGTTSTILDQKDATDIFSILASQEDGLENLSNSFLDTGITHYSNGDYEEAAKAFEAAIAIDPDSDNNSNTTKYLAQAYLNLDKTDKAIETYEKGIQRNREDDSLRNALGQLYYSEDRYEEAARQYRAAVEIDASSENRYAYGEALLKVEDYEEAEIQFEMVKQSDPDSTAGDYGLGKMYALMEDYESAIAHFESALEIDSAFYDAYAQIGYAYADMGETATARQIQEQLEDLDDDLALTLEYYIDEVEAPQIAFAYSTSTFPSKMSTGYPVSAIDSYLENAGAEVSLTMKFQFTKEMDSTSVENIYNWSITRATSDNLAKDYNFGDDIPSTEVNLQYYPDYAVYDWDTCSATIGFTIRQNETADGTIDPGHIVFKFDGEDVYGVSMDEDADEYSGFSGIA